MTQTDTDPTRSPRPIDRPDEAAAPNLDQRRGPRRPGLVVLLIAFAALTSLLMVENRPLFSSPVHEHGDAAANTIIIDEAKRFSLLVGHYSRHGFSHPGPALYYAQAAGEEVFDDLLDVTPARYNGRTVTVLVLNAALVSVALAIVASIVRLRWALVALVGVPIVMAIAALNGPLLSSPWPPLAFFAPFLLLLVAAAAVAAGHARFLWALALGSGVLVHAHTQFLFFVPLITGAALVAYGIGRRRAVSGYVGARRDWIVAGAIGVIFLLPLVVQVVRDFPGQFDEYWNFANSDTAGGHSLSAAVRYTAQFWFTAPALDGTVDRFWSTHLVWYAPAAIVVAGVVLLLVRGSRDPQRRFLYAAAGAVGLATAGLVFYAARGIDDLSAPYLGFFYLAGPALLLLVIAVGVVARLPWRWAQALVVAAVVAGGATAIQRWDYSDDYDGRPELPRVVSALGERRASTSQPIVLELEDETWADAVGVLVHANRGGIPACFNDKSWSFMVTDRFICTRSERARGKWFHLGPRGTAKAPVATLAGADITESSAFPGHAGRR